jgi:A/G-specific adenine glycosylase
MSQFSQKILQWWDLNGRKDLPWQPSVEHPITPYRVWISEIMLQQTQVKTVIPYYQRFMEKYPDVFALAKAEQDDILHLWTGLGYYARARNMHKAAQMLVNDFNGEFPATLDEVQILPGIGRSTAAAILSLSRNQTETILDGNVKRVLSRYYAINEWPGTAAITKDLWLKAVALTPKIRNDHYTQAMMDMGATLCTRSKPNCAECPLNQDCKAYELNLTKQIPVSKPKKEKPIRSAFFLMLKNADQQLLLEQQAQTGLWGGLYVFPKFDELDQMKHWLVQKGLNITLDESHIWSEFRHTFSHYHLDITPVLIDIEKETHQIKEDCLALNTSRWCALDLEAEGVGVAAPVVKLVNQIGRTLIR